MNANALSAPNPCETSTDATKDIDSSKSVTPIAIGTHVSMTRPSSDLDSQEPHLPRNIGDLPTGVTGADPEGLVASPVVGGDMDVDMESMSSLTSLPSDDDNMDQLAPPPAAVYSTDFLTGREGSEFPKGTKKISWPGKIETFGPFTQANVKGESYSVRPTALPLIESRAHEARGYRTSTTSKYAACSHLQTVPWWSRLIMRSTRLDRGCWPLLSKAT